MEYSKQAHSVYYTRYHLVMSTKYRRRILRARFGEYLKRLVVGIGKQSPGIEIIEPNTKDDHVYLLLSIPPKLSVSEVAKQIRAKTRIAMRKRFPFLDKVY